MRQVAAKYESVYAVFDDGVRYGVVAACGFKILPTAREVLFLNPYRKRQRKLVFRGGLTHGPATRIALSGCFISRTNAHIL